MKIYLVRHGETEWNRQGRIQGSADIPLNEYGIELAEVTAEKLKGVVFDRIYTSPLVRARQTAEILRGGRDTAIVADARLSEMSFGMYEGQNIREASADPANPLHNFLKHPEQYWAADGENFADVIARARSFIDEVLLPAGKVCETVLITAHGAFIRCFLRCIEERPIADFWNGAPQKNCAVTIIHCSGTGFGIEEEGKLYYEGA